jgi:hypothetical protein
MKTESEIRQEIKKYENSIDETKLNIEKEKDWLAKASITIENLHWCLTDSTAELQAKIPVKKACRTALDDDDLIEDNTKYFGE